ncbi:hypothetical protein DACRYDRAFT_109989 [Dacryopinax primogenitus]|uniref:Uncharacterized protein n=1 Tax=Dacryopinax primogenitus (strain DJM 731) TaxID=1858805 RepID=M5FUT4_DACPD|nr:uncharacterized protein DACRYDRAFT_109989 [Dacryopinax primogenitus]EJT99269.1 hypothetical protein DACRYDRAFT_109989 [Dacryopinax primogenitus]
MSTTTIAGPPALTTPTATGLLIMTEMDALRLFEAARLYPTHFPMIPNRIEDWKIRLDLFVHGSVFIFQRGPEFVRWTDGRRWMPNQQIGPFLCYEEANRRQPPQGNYRAGVNRAERGYNRPECERREGGLQKWTYTVHVLPNPQVPDHRLVWEIVWYLQPLSFTPTGSGLIPVSRHDFLRTINIPQYLYFMEGTLPLPRQTSNIVRIPETGLLRTLPPSMPPIASIPRPMSVPPQHMRRPSAAQSDASDDKSPSPRPRFHLPPFTDIINSGRSRTIAYDHARLPSYAEFISRTQNLPESPFEPSQSRR